MKNITFTIASASSSDFSFPATNLALLQTQPDGWQSARFCTYPQELLIQFPSCVNIHKVQFLSHEKKITQRVEVFVAQNTTVFQKIGYFTFQSNEQSNWQARELKTVNISREKCYFLKFSIAKNYDNRYNPFNQVGLIAVRVYGEISQLPPPIINQQQQVLPVIQQNHEEIDIDQKTLQHIYALEFQKDYAIKVEDFDQAKKIKTRIDDLKRAGQQIKQLEDQKKLAILSEDYDLAQQYKEKIQEAKIQANLIDHYGNDIKPNINYQRESVSAMSKKFADGNHPQQQQPHHQQLQNQPSNQQQSFQQVQQSSSQQQFQLQSYEQYDNDQQQNFYDEIKQQDDKQKEFYNEDNNFSKDQQEITQITQHNQYVNHDDMIIPTLQGKNKKTENDQELDPKQQNGEFMPEILSPENEVLAEPLKPFFTEDFCRKFFSKQWTWREKAFIWLNLELEKPKEIKTTPPELFMQLALQVVQYGLWDKIERVATASMVTLSILLSKYDLKQEQVQKGDITILLDNIILVLMEKIGDTQRSKDEAEKLIELLSDKYGTLQIVNHLIKGITTKPKLQQSGKHIQGRLLIIHHLIQTHGINNEKMPYNPIIDLAIKQLENSNEGVRTAAIYIITEAYKKVGVKVRYNLGSLRPAQQQLLDELFEKIDQGGQIENMLDREGQRKQIIENLPKAQKGKQDDRQQVVDIATTDQCEFCGSVNEEFTKNVQLDLHLWRECVMLTICESCAQVVEISTLSQHHLEECQKYKEYRECSRCGCSVLQQKLEKHLASNICSQSSGSVCPLCFQQVKENGWKSHLSSCEKNERVQKVNTKQGN